MTLPAGLLSGGFKLPKLSLPGLGDIGGLLGGRKPKHYWRGRVRRKLSRLEAKLAASPALAGNSQFTAKLAKLRERRARQVQKGGGRLRKVATRARASGATKRTKTKTRKAPQGRGRRSVMGLVRVGGRTYTLSQVRAGFAGARAQARHFPELRRRDPHYRR